MYNRQSVRWEIDQYDTRPEPLDHKDIPHDGGRGKYTRQDGTVYQFDCQGYSFEVVNGMVYQDIEEVRDCYAAKAKSSLTIKGKEKCQV